MSFKYIIAIFLFTFLSCQPNARKHSYAVSAATPEATQAGMDIIEKGGNAIDAAVAVAFALAVTEPAMTGLGAGIQILVSKPGEEPFIINGTTYSPKATPVAALEEDILYHRRSTIPSFVKTLGFGFEKYGSGKLSWEELLKPAIDYADDGFQVGLFRAKVYQKYEKQLLESPYNMEHFLINGAIPKEGELLKQPMLANTLRRLSRAGADDFYNGEMAFQIAEDMNTHGGWITLQDLNDFPEPHVVPALTTTYKNYLVYTSTPPCGGWVVLLALNAMEIFTKSGTNENRHKDLINALAIAHGERLKNPVEDMIDYHKDVFDKISKDKARLLGNQYSKEHSSMKEENTGETTHFSIVDAEGMAVSVTTSINAYFGSRAASKQLGFIYNSYMEDFVFGDSTHSFAVGPHKMAYSSMSPTIVRNDKGENVLALGSPGSARIISAVTQTAQYWMEINNNIDEAVAAPRIHVNWTTVYCEFEPNQLLIEYLNNQGFKLGKVDKELSIGNLNAYFGGVHAVAYEGGKWVGSADPRRDGIAKSNFSR